MNSDKSDKTQRDSLAINEEKEKKPPRDRDQSVNSPARAKDKADRAEFGDTPGTHDQVKPDEPLIARDNMKGAPPRSGST